MKEICAVIPTLLNGEILQKCLRFLFSALSFVPDEKKAAIVVNNGGQFKKEFLDQRVTLIQNKKNLGFACAVNQGI